MDHFCEIFQEESRLDLCRGTESIKDDCPSRQIFIEPVDQNTHSSQQIYKLEFAQTERTGISLEELTNTCQEPSNMRNFLISGTCTFQEPRWAIDAYNIIKLSKLDQSISKRHIKFPPAHWPQQRPLSIDQHND